MNKETFEKAKKLMEQIDGLNYLLDKISIIKPDNLHSIITSNNSLYIHNLSTRLKQSVLNLLKKEIQNDLTDAEHKLAQL